jgi:hypothetical protein
VQLIETVRRLRLTDAVMLAVVAPSVAPSGPLNVSPPLALTVKLASVDASGPV